MRAHSFFLVGAEKLHLPLLLYTGDRCHENLQQLQFVTGHNLRLLNQHQQLKKKLKTISKTSQSAERACSQSKSPASLLFLVGLFPLMSIYFTHIKYIFRTFFLKLWGKKKYKWKWKFSSMLFICLPFMACGVYNHRKVSQLFHVQCLSNGLTTEILKKLLNQKLEKRRQN